MKLGPIIISVWIGFGVRFEGHEETDSTIKVKISVPETSEVLGADGDESVPMAGKFLARRYKAKMSEMLQASGDAREFIVMSRTREGTHWTKAMQHEVEQGALQWAREVEGGKRYGFLPFL